MVSDLNKKNRHGEEKILVEKVETDDEGTDGSENEATDDEVEINPNGAIKERSDDTDFDYEAAAREAFEKFGKPFMSEVLPKLPKLRNGMRLLGVNERSPLLNSGELFKMRLFRPERPLATSELFEDGTRMRLTNLSRMMNDDFVISKFKIEAVTHKSGLADSDMVGLKTTPGLFEAEDVGNLTMKPFMERKVKGKSSLNY